MRKDAIEGMVDKLILENINNNLSIKTSQLELQEKIIKFKNLLERDNIDVESTVLTANENWEEIPSARHRFAAYYICFAVKRIIDLDWYSNKRLVVPSLNKRDMLKVIKFRDKLSKENAKENLPF